MLNKANTICIDFDWTLCKDDSFGKIDGTLKKLIKEHNKNYNFIIYTSRKRKDKDKIVSWLKKNGISGCISKIVFNKPSALIYIDDRGYRYSINRLKKDKDLKLKVRLDLLVDFINNESDRLAAVCSKCGKTMDIKKIYSGRVVFVKIYTCSSCGYTRIR